MMVVSDLDIGTKLELELYNDDGIRLDYTLASEFEWAISENTAMIAAPIREGVIYPVRLGAIINIYFTVKKESYIRLFSFSAKVTGRDKTENLHLLKISSVNEIEEIQRRRHYRLECSLQVKFRVVDTLDAGRNQAIPFRETIACNLSGGGICLLLEEKIETGKLIECVIATSTDRTITFFGKIVRNEINEVKSKFKYEAGITYVKIDEKDREAVVRYIFAQQRILRKKGLI